MAPGIRYGPFLRVLQLELKCPRGHVYEWNTFLVPQGVREVDTRLRYMSHICSAVQPVD